MATVPERWLGILRSHRSVFTAAAAPPGSRRGRSPGNPVLPFRSSAPRLVLVALSSTCSLETEGLTVALEQTFPALQLTRCVTLGKLLGLSVPGFPWCISFL